MIPSIELANALDKAAEMIAENTDAYNFSHIDTCNLGYLVRAISGISVDEAFLLGTLGYYTEGARTFFRDDYCFVCNKKIPETYVILANAGVGKKDFEYIEFLGKGMPSLRARLHNDIKMPTAEEAIVFFRNEAKKMREQLQVKIPVGKKTVEKVPVSVV